jgi:hypothetical protein
VVSLGKKLNSQTIKLATESPHERLYRISLKEKVVSGAEAKEEPEEPENDIVKKKKKIMQENFMAK